MQRDAHFHFSPFPFFCTLVATLLRSWSKEALDETAKHSQGYKHIIAVAIALAMRTTTEAVLLQECKINAQRPRCQGISRCHMKFGSCLQLAVQEYCQ